MANLGGVALLMKKNEPANPMKISLFGAVAVMTQSDQVADLIEQFLFRLAVGRRCDYKRIHDSVFIGSPRGKQADYTE